MIPKRSQRQELDTVPLCLRKEASPFWIILLLGDRAQPKIKLAILTGQPNKFDLVTKLRRSGLCVLAPSLNVC
jgi:hypothetical protein